MAQINEAALREEGNRIVQQMGHGLYYNGPWISGNEFLGHTLTDVAGCGTTFICKDLEDCKRQLIKKRKEFGVTPPTFSPQTHLLPAVQEGGIDVGIADLIKKLNQAGYKTIQSCSGLRSDHPEDQYLLPSGREAWLGQGYICFLKQDLTPEKIVAIEGSALASDLEIDHGDCFFMPSIAVRTSKLHGGSYYDILRKASEETGPTPLGQGDFLEWLARRDRLFQEKFKAAGGYILDTDDKIKEAWRRFEWQLLGNISQEMSPQVMPQTLISDEALDFDRVPIPFTPVKRLERGKLYVRKVTRPHPIEGYHKSHEEYSVVDLQKYRKGYEPRLELLGVYTPDPQDTFRIGTGRLPPYQPTITGDKLQSEMEHLGFFEAWRISPEYLPSTDGGPFINVGERVRFIGTSRSRYETWPEGAWLEKGVEGTVSEYHPPQPAVTIRGQYFEGLEPWAVVNWDNGGQTSILPDDEGERWERIGSFSPKLVKSYPSEWVTVEIGTAKVRGQFRLAEGIEPEVVVEIIKPTSPEIRVGSQEDIDLGKAREELTRRLEGMVKESPQDEIPVRGEPVKGTHPTVLTMDEFNKEWKPQGWNIIFIGPTSTWRQEWGIWEAIRDIVQNALDEAESYKWGCDDLGLWISDKGKGVGVADFLLGPPKLKPDYARGKFGEGMKIAGLALVRAGYPVNIKTVGRELWIIFIEQPINGKAESLAALWRPGGTTQGTIFHIIGYFGFAYQDRFAVNLPRAAIKAQVPAPTSEPVQRYNQLIEYNFPPENIEVEKGWYGESEVSGNRIYARDIYLRTIVSRFSYNLWGFPLAPDRHGPAKEGDLWVDMGRLWAGVKDVELLEHFFKMMRDPPDINSDESHHLSMSSYAMGTNPKIDKSYSDMVGANAELWRQAWENCFGDNAVLRIDERWDATVKHLGYYSISLYYAVTDCLREVIMTDKGLVEASQERLREVQIIPDGQLNATARVHLELARKMAQYLEGVSPVRGTHAAVIPPASDRVRTAGMYGRNTGEVYIAIEQLGTGRATVDTAIHEIAHHTSGAEDGEEAHNKELTRLAGETVQLVSRGQFDDIIKKPDFTW